MDNEARINLLARIAQVRVGTPPSGIRGLRYVDLVAGGRLYGLRPSEDATVPTGFDPMAMALFEAIVEGAYLVATADSVFDASERKTFERVVVAACGAGVAPEQIAALVSDLGDQLTADGLERRVQVVARSITKKEHAHEVLRIAALLAQASEDVSAPERDVLSRIARACNVDAGEVDAALSEARKVLASG